MKTSKYFRLLRYKSCICKLKGLSLRLCVLLYFIRSAHSKDYVKITNCLAKDNNISFTPVDAFSIAPKWESGDKQMVHNYDWTYKVTYSANDETNITLDHTKWLQPMSNNTYKLFIPKYTLPINTRTKVTVYSKRKPSVKTGPENPLEGGFKECFIPLGSRRPSPIIEGGHKRCVPPAITVFLNAENSINQNCGPNCTKHLYFHWNCTQTLTPINFCTHSPISIDPKFRIPGRFVREGDEFTIMLELEAERAAFPIQATQTIIVISDPIMLDVSCKQNCLPVTYMSNHQTVTAIEATCLENCEGLNDKSYEWTLTSANDSSFNFDYSRTRHGRRDPKFVIEKNVLEPGMQYIAEVRVRNSNGNEGSGAVLLKVYRQLQLESCKTEPEKGQSLITLFKFSCVQWPIHQQNVYELYVEDSVSKKRSLLLTDLYPDILEHEFTLPASEGKKFIVRVSHEIYPFGEAELKVEVTSSLRDKPLKEVTSILNQMYNGNSSKDSITNKLASSVPEQRIEAMERLQAIVEEIGAHNLKDEAFGAFVNKLKYRVADDLLKAPVQSIEEMVKATETITLLQGYNDDSESEPALAKLVTTLCRKMITKALGMMQGEKSQNSAHQSQELSESAADCLETNSNPNHEALKGIHWNITTPAPVLDESLLTENYPNYVDHDIQYFKSLEDLQESTYNLINGTAAAAKVRALTAHIGEGIIKYFGRSSETVVLKDIGDELAKIPILSKGITLLPSKDFVNDSHPYDILMTIWSRNILWWDPGATRIPTPIISCNFWHSTCKDRVSEFKRPVEIYFFLKGEAKSAFEPRNFSFVVPKGYTGMSNEDLNHQIQVHRFGLLKGEIITIGFHNLISGNSFSVVSTLNEFPTIEDFKNSTGVRMDSNYTLKLINEYDYDILAYVGILIHRSGAVEGEEVAYELSSAVKSCMKWHTDQTRWVPACKAGNKDNATTIHCRCYRFSILAGHIQHVDSLLQQVYKPEFQLEMLSCRIVFFTLVVTLTLFFLLSLYLHWQRKETVYYVGDNNAMDRFAYLVVVGTGIGFHDGTSSNVVIKLTGDKKSSESFVLNYPDPAFRILQQGTRNSFVVSTEEHLGRLNKVEIWFDCAGQNPAWYCDDVMVFDLQQRITWCFVIKQRLTVMTRKVYVEALPKRMNQNHKWQTYEQDSIKVNTLSFFKKKLHWSEFKMAQRFHTWCMWQEEENFSYLKKLTVILSKILMIYSLVLCSMGLPGLELRDGFDGGYEIGIYEILLAFGCAFPAFVIHMCIAWIFRYSRSQYRVYDYQFGLSFRFALACWLIISGVIVGSITLLLIFGFWVPRNKSLVWLTICVIAIFIEILIYEGVSNWIQSCFWRCELVDTIWMRFTEICKHIETQRKYLFEQFGQRLLRPYLKHLYTPLDEEQIREKRTLLKNRYAVIGELEDLIMFGVYISLLYAVILANKDSLVVYGHQEMIELMDGIQTRSIDFRRIEFIDEIYHYINETLIQAVQPTHWYGNYVISEPGLMVDMTNKYVGVVRLRQHRMPSGLCESVQMMSFLNMSCWPEFSSQYIETKTFGHSWGRFTSLILKDRLRRMWQYSEEDMTRSFFTIGKFATYPGGGYIAYLGRTLYNSYSNHNKIYMEWWITQKTRVVFVEFLTYSANYNVFNSIKLIIEQSATGFLDTQIKVDTIRMLFVKDEFEVISAGIFSIFVIWVCLLLFKQSIGIIKNVKTFYRYVWTLIDILILLLSGTCIVLFIVRTEAVGSYLAEIEQAKHNEFINYFYLFYIEYFLTLVAAILVCVSTIRLWKFLKFAKMFRLFERTVMISIKPILTFGIFNMVFVLASSFTLVMFLGKEYEKMSSLLKVAQLLTTMTMISAEIRPEDYLKKEAAMFYVIIIMLMAFVVKIMFISIIVMCYGRSQMLFSDEPERYSIKHYVQERMAYLSKYFKYRLKSGQEDVDEKVRPKADKFVFLNCHSIPSSRLKVIGYSAECIIRKKIKKNLNFTEHDTKLISLICQNSIRKRGDGKIEVFFAEHIKNTRVVLVSGRRIEVMAGVANRLLSDESGAFMQQERNPKLEECVKVVHRSLKVMGRCEMELKLQAQKMIVAEEQIGKFGHVLF